ncbi:glycoside hydrolase superfamily [Sphaerosporella brunnea]|uniref:Glycoside hydrolase superfamily n=1 Tax=Sphaerosporella brunnea TaxID=1250544 RepID=A0A5J5EFW2_9PEZI|nr:glycoside hydrolase superfamily [Sphaerosporella brunnea]
MFGNSLLNLVVAALAASSVVTAQPHKRRHIHKRAPAPEPAIVTVYNDVATVWVDQHGNMIDPKAPRTITVTVTGAAACAAAVTTTSKAKATTTISYTPSTTIAATSKSSSIPAPKPTYSSSSKAVAVSTTSSKAPAIPTTSQSSKAVVPSSSSKAAIVPTIASKTSAAPAATSSASLGTYVSGTYPAGGASKPGIVYSPYNADRSCKTADEVAADIEKIKDFSPIRLYGVDCNQTQNVIAAAKPYGTKVMAAIYNMDDPYSELETLIEAVNGEWDSVHTVAIGNEVVNFGKKTADQYATIINNCRKRLRSGVGYIGPVVGVDTFVAIMANPQIAEASDYVAANAHPYFDGGVLAQNSGTWLDAMKVAVQAKCGTSKEIVITETGWPTQGGTNGLGVPGVANQKVAIEGIVKTQGKNTILFTAFDDLWKTDTAATLGAEKYWGIQDLSLS